MPSAALRVVCTCARLACRCSFYSSVEVVAFAKSLSDHSFINTKTNQFFPYARVLSLNGYATFLRLFDAAASKVCATYTLVWAEASRPACCRHSTAKPASPLSCCSCLLRSRNTAAARRISSPASYSVAERR